MLLGVVVVEATLLEAAPISAAGGDLPTVATTFALSNGVFARIFPLAPAPLLFTGLGIVLSRSSFMPAVFGISAIVIAVFSVISGIMAIFGPIGLILAITMSIVEAVWILAAAIAFARAAWK